VKRSKDSPTSSPTQAQAAGANDRSPNLSGAGRLPATAGFCGFKVGCVAGFAGIRHLHGLPQPREIMLPVRIIGLGNSWAWLTPAAQLRYPA
jgi:hypothetical protein